MCAVYRYMFRSVVFSCLCLLAAGCRFDQAGRVSRPSDEARSAAVRIGSVYYSPSDLDRFFKSRLSEFRNSDADDVSSALLETFIDEKLLLLEADRRQVSADPESLRLVMQSMAKNTEEEDQSLGEVEPAVSESLKIQAYINAFVFQGLQVTEGECLKYYEEHLGDFVRNDVVHVREILVEEQALANKIQASLKANRNRNFAELARLHSKAPSAIRGGDLGRFQRGELPEKLERAIFRLAPGTVSALITTEFGYHMFLVEEKVLAHQQRLYQARKEIEEKLLLDKQRAALEEEIAFLAQRTPVVVYAVNLGFHYSGSKYSSRGENSP